MPLLFLGPQEIMIIGGLVLLFFFVPRKLPQIGAGLGQGIRNFKDSLTGKDEPKIEEGKDSEKPSA